MSDAELIADRREARLIKATMWAGISPPAALVVIDLVLTGPRNLPGALWFLFFVAGVAFAHALFIGLPLYLLLAKRWRIRWWMCALAGVVIGGVPLPLLLLTSNTYISGDFWDVVKAVAPFAGCGLIGGAAFGVRVTREAAYPSDLKAASSSSTSSAVL